MKQIKSVVLAAIAVIVAAAYTVPAPVVSAQSSAALSIVPKKNYVIEPGKSVNDKMTIRNLDTGRDLQLTLRVVDFTFTDDGGTPKLMMDPNAQPTTWSLKPYLTVPKTVTIPKSSSKTLDMSVKIPKGHGAGSYYSAIVYSSGAPSGGGNVGLAASGVTLVFTQIPGKVTEDLKLEKFGAYKDATASTPAGYTFFTMDEPMRMAYTLKNGGNVTEAPVGSITIKGWIGEPITISNVNPTGSLALIGQTRTYSACIKLKEAEVNFNGSVTRSPTCVSPGLWPGIYSASLDLYYGQNGNNTKEVTGSTTFWYFPAWFLLLMAFLLLIVAYFAWRGYRLINGKVGGGRSYKKSSRHRR